jgi:hypothetical protein
MRLLFKDISIRGNILFLIFFHQEEMGAAERKAREDEERREALGKYFNMNDREHLIEH